MADVDLSGYPVTLLADVLARTVDDAVMSGLAARGFDDITRAHGVVFEMIDPGGSRVSDMAARARITKQGMGQLVAALEGLGYVERVPDPTDGRAQLVRVTPAGRRAADAGRDGLLALERRWQELLGERRYASVRKALAELAVATGHEHIR